MPSPQKPNPGMKVRPAAGEIHPSPNAKPVTSPRNRSESRQESTSPKHSLFGGIALSKLEGFCSRLATGLKAGVDILRLLEAETKHGSARHRSIAQSLIQSVRSGESLSESMVQQGNYFPILLVRVIRAGEHSGRVDHCFAEMASHYRELKRARAKFLGQVTFPLISFAMAIFVITLVIFINGFMQSGSPSEPAFDLTGVGLRGFTGVLIFWGMLFGLGCIVSLVAFGVWKNWFQCHKTLIPLIRNVPVIGPVFTTLAMSRLTMTLSMMLGAGVDARRSVRESLLSTGNYYYMAGIETCDREIERGKSFAEALDAPKLLPSEFIQAVEIGELSGTDSESLERLALTYRERAQSALSKLAIFAGMAIWLMISALIIFAIFMIFFQVMKVYSDALNFK
jgi:type IV pilus assembly protein PilC